jgi:hypothetical protein
MAYRRATATRNAVADAEGDLLDGGSIAAGGTLLGTLTFNATAFGAPATTD